MKPIGMVEGKPNWLGIDRDELLTFLGLITMMGIKKLYQE